MSSSYPFPPLPATLTTHLINLPPLNLYISYANGNIIITTHTGDVHVIPVAFNITPNAINDSSCSRPTKGELTTTTRRYRFKNKIRQRKTHLLRLLGIRCMDRRNH